MLSKAETLVVGLALIGLGATLWAIRNATEDGRDIGILTAEHCIDSETAVRLTGVVSNIPALDSVISSSPLTASYQRPPATLFLLRAESLIQTEATLTVHGVCRVRIDGDATTRLSWGDRVELTGQIDVAGSPLNPGEFDYARYLSRNGISAMMFLKHPAAVRIIRSDWWHPRSLLTAFRQQTVDLLKKQLSLQNRATAEALLLGNRGHLTPDLQRDFIASGTMHLLAISGLHVGILYVFLLRVLNLMLVPRTRSLILAGTICVLYCFLTDLCPSVMRATLFIVLHILGQILYRDIRMGSLIGVTTMILVLLDPAIAFDVGAWLSFLAVGALGWVADRRPPPVDRPAPADAPGWQERLHDMRLSALDWLGLSYRQMLAVTLLSAPLVMSQFHLVSMTGMVINVALIPFTTLTLIAGYLFVAIGMAVPVLAFLPAMVFQMMLSSLNGIVSWMADIRIGFLTIPDLPNWFLPAYFALVFASVIAANPVLRQAVRLMLLIFVGAVLWIVCQPPDTHGLVCTTLSVGHGNAVIVETPDNRVLVFDAGAMNRGERTAGSICQFLWHRGYRMIDAIVISHPDADHYNAVASLMDRIPVGQVLITTDFARSQAAEVQHVLQTLAGLKVPAVIAMHGDSFSVGELTVDLLQADFSHEVAFMDNEMSLIAILNYRDRRICLPGDLEGGGQAQLLSVLPACDLLVSPHHGSLASNTREFANRLHPATVVVSANKDRQVRPLENVFHPARIYLTARDGAVTYRVAPDGSRSVETFIDSPVAISENTQPNSDR